MKPHKKSKIPKPRVPRWTAHMEAKARDAAAAAAAAAATSELSGRTKKKPILIPIPPGAVRADPSRQNLGYSDKPILYYQDQELTCDYCRKVETWTALQQRWWYETVQAPRYKKMTCCRACRKAKRVSDAESLHKAWMARFERLKRLQPQLEKTSGCSELGGEVYALLDHPLSILGLKNHAISACATIGIETLRNLLSHEFTSPLPDFHLSDWDSLLGQLKTKLNHKP